METIWLLESALAALNTPDEITSTETINII
jgi:hypothetical protein